MIELFPNIDDRARNRIQNSILFAANAPNPTAAIRRFKPIWDELSDEEQEYALFLIEVLKDYPAYEEDIIN